MPEKAESVIIALRSVGPPGIAATSALDCVRLQVEVLIAEGLATELLRSIVDDWLPQVADQRWNEIAEALETSEAEVRQAVEILTRETRPFVSLDGGADRAGMVDVEFVLDGADLRAMVQNADGLGLRVADDFGELDREARAWLAPHRAAASQLVAAVNARARVLTQVADILATRQHTYLILGDNHQPLRRADVAVEIGVHPSTVGRAVAGKTARCPDGRLLPLAALFGAGSATLERVAAVIADVPNATDSALADELTRRGWPIARRTVAKYRALLARST
jgi:RNA polymerase sigma-54 factor